jgi:transcriptional repressor NrdR
MLCPFCDENNDKVVDSRESKDGTVIRRRRECLACSRRFTSYERMEEVPFRVIKKDNRREDFSPQKLLGGLRKACEKRIVAARELEAIVEEVEKRLQESSEKEISTREIGEFVMKELANLDKVAYVRFASVYREFEDVTEFLTELEGLLNEKKRK